MVINLNKCVRCYACVYACIRENVLRYGDNGQIYYPPVEDIIYYSRTKPLITYNDEGDPIATILTQCEHCENAPCVSVCPTGASYITKEGVVLVDSNKCIQCLLCMDACPYDEVRTRLTTYFNGKLNNNLALKIGVPDKCTFCYHRKTDDKSLWTPACVEACAFNARVFGDLDNPQDPINEIISSGNVVVPKSELGTRPKVFYVTDKPLATEKYPLHPTSQQIIKFDFWSYVKKKIIEPIVIAGASLAVVFGVAHIVREYLREKKEGGEVNE
jgi:tetrathionate reductase subunit B